MVDAGKKDKLQLVLDGVSVHSGTSAALYILEADKVFVTLADGTENTLSNGGSFTPVDDNNIDGAVFSKQGLTFNGSGSLTVTSPGGHGIVCKDDLVFTGGSYTVSAASHGLDANDSVRVTGASFTIDAGKDGVHAENKDDETRGFVYVSGGSAKASKQSDISCKGMKVTGDLLVHDGSFSIDSADDAVGNRSAGTQIVLKDSSGHELVSCAPELSFAVVILSTPEMVKGETYTISAGTSSGDVKAS